MFVFFTEPCCKRLVQQFSFILNTTITLNYSSLNLNYLLNVSVSLSLRAPIKALLHNKHPTRMKLRFTPLFFMVRPEIITFLFNTVFNTQFSSKQWQKQKEIIFFFLLSYFQWLVGDLSVYESIRGSGNTGSGTNSINFDNSRAVRNVNIYSDWSNFIISADEYNNVTSGFQLEGLDKRSEYKKHEM